MSTVIKFCEFPGDDKHDWDEVGYKARCPSISVMNKCLRHSQPLGEDSEGWLICCADCVTPVHTRKK